MKMNLGLIPESQEVEAVCLKVPFWAILAEVIGLDLEPSSGTFPF